MNRDRPKDSRAPRRVLFRFLIVGSVSSLSYSLIFALILQLADVPVFASSVALFCVFIVMTYQFHKHFTFGAQSLKRSAFPSYAALQLTCFSAVSWISANLVTGNYPLDTTLYLVTVGLSAGLTFVIGKLVIFREP